MKRSTIVFAAISGVCLALSMTMATSLVRAQESAASGYKIGVVNIREVFQQYNRREAQFQDLLDKRQAAQDKVDKLAADINAQREKYNKQKEDKSISEDDLTQMEMDIYQQISNLEAERTKLQNEVSMIEDQKLKALNEEIRVAIAAIGQAENYHLVLESDAGGGSVLYSATPLDLTSKVIDRLNKNAK